MYTQFSQEAVINTISSTVLISTVLLSTLLTDIAAAKYGRGDENRSEYYGIIRARPLDGRQGKWVINERIFITDQNTEFDETEGPLNIGICVKVHLRNGRVHEIDSEPMQDCQ